MRPKSCDDQQSFSKSFSGTSDTYRKHRQHSAAIEIVLLDTIRKERVERKEEFLHFSQSIIDEYDTFESEKSSP